MLKCYDYILIYSAFNKYTFATLSSGGILKTITDVNGNSLDFTCDENGKPKSVKMIPSGSSSSVTHFTITNNASGVLRYVLDSSRQQAVLFYYSNTYNGDISSSGYKYLRKIVYAHQSGSTSSSNWSSFYSSGTNSYITVDAECYYNYDSAGHIVSVKDDLHKIEIAYTYDSAGRVSSVCEKAGSSSSVGQTVGFTYGLDYTKVRTSGKDDIYGNSDDIFTVYTFDREGRCVSTYSTDINGYTIYGATSGEYVDDNEKAKNSIKTSSSISDIATNYLLNSNFEINGVSSLSCWTKSGNVTAVDLNYQNITRPKSYNQNSYDSDYNVKITAPAGATSGISQNVVLSSGTYTLSADLNNESMETLTVRLKVKSMDNLSTVYTEEVHFTNDYDYPVTAEGTLTFDVDTTSTERFTVSIEVIGENGVNTSSDFVWVRHATLSKSVGYSMNNRVNYGSFEASVLNGETTRYPLSNFWTSVGGSSNVTTTTHSSFAGNSLYVSGAGIGNDSYVKQTIYTATSVEEGYFRQNPALCQMIPQKLYRVSGRALSTNAIASENSTFAVVVVVTYVSQNGTTETSEHPFAFNNHIDSWQFVSGVFATRAGQFVKKIEIYCQFNDQTGSAYFDDISMCYIGENDYPAVYDYDENTGMLTEVLSPFSRICYEYCDDGIKIYRKIETKSVTFYTYDDKDRVKKVEYYSFGGNWREEKCGYNTNSTLRLRSTTTYEYDTYGLLKEEKVTSADGKALVTTREYDTSTMKIFGALIEEIDALGNSTEYFYDSKYGYLLASIGPDGNGMTYTYDAWGRMTLALPAVTSGSSYTSAGPERVAYAYDDADRLSTISRYGTSYSFLYDVFGNTTSISVGNHQLAGYTYNANNGKLATMTYGNGTSVKYDYDTLDRVEKIWYKETGESAYTLAYEYKYDSNGYLNTFYDYVNGNVTNYRYDSAGRLHEYYVNSASEDGKQSSLFYTYDAEGRVERRQYRQDYTYSGGSAEIGFYNYYTYDDSDGSLTSARTEFGNYQLGVTYTYDNLGRLTQKSQRLQHEHSSSASGVVTQQYEYTTRDNGTKLSLQISKMTSIVTGQSNKEYTYEYDSNGNITKISLGGVVQYAYQYDKLGQLVRVDDSVAGYTYVYYYNNHGGIQFKRTYPLGSTSGTSINTKSYNYVDSSWGDLLTHYNNVSMTYDEIGNPLTYYNGFTFTWKQGRRLAEARNGSIELFFKYNDEGIRTSKEVNGVEHIYHVVGSTILSEEWTDANGVHHILAYLYDAQDSPIGMGYRNSTYPSGTVNTYWFEKNLQGDVIAVYNENAYKLVSYVYDAWGKIIKTDYYNDGASTAVQYNPFRYRGYYYDSELGFYYLNSRYYDPETGRFISADGFVSTCQGILGYNMFAYCRNEPVFRKDAYGTEDVCVTNADDNNPLNDLLGYSPSGSGSGGAYGYFDSYAYQTYSIKSATDAYNAGLGGYYAPSLSSGVTNPGYYNVLGAVSVTDNMASTNYMKPTARIPNKKSVVNHIFNNRSGHILRDTPGARYLLESTTANKYYYGHDMYGNAWYQQMQTNGSQIWVEVRSNVIIDGGINGTPRSWDPMTGFKQNLGGRR